MIERREMMALDCGDLLLVERSATPALEGERAEGAVALVAACASGDLRHLRHRQPPRAPPVKLAQRGEGDMGDIHVEAHADRVGSDEIIDLARLEHRDLAHCGCAGESAPITTAAPPRSRRSISATA
jgi:hypothetical protein